MFAKLTGRIESEHRLDAETAAQCVDQATAYLAACATTTEPLAPSMAADIGWHTFILHTIDYAAFCDQVAGRFIHHVPTDEHQGHSDEAIQAVLDATTASLWELADTPPLDEATARAFAPEARRWERMRPWQHLAAEPPEGLDPWVRAGLDEFANAECDALQALAGDRLVHTDIHPCNVLIDQRAHLIDWAWARPGAPWMDAELVAFRLVAAGHTGTEADRWRLQHLPHAGLAPEIRSAFATEMLGTWLHLAERRPSRPLLRQNAAAALRWARYLHETG